HGDGGPPEYGHRRQRGVRRPNSRARGHARAFAAGREIRQALRRARPLDRGGGGGLRRRCSCPSVPQLRARLAAPGQAEIANVSQELRRGRRGAALPCLRHINGLTAYCLGPAVKTGWVGSCPTFFTKSTRKFDGSSSRSCGIATAITSWPRPFCWSRRLELCAATSGGGARKAPRPAPPSRPPSRPPRPAKAAAQRRPSPPPSP